MTDIIIKFSPNKDLDTIQSIILNSFNLACNTLTEKHLAKYKYIIKIINPNFDLQYFDLTPEYKDMLINMGKSSVEQFISSLKN